MASIQVLELCPIEDQIKDLSYDEAGGIQGGADRITEALMFIVDFYETNNLGEFYDSFGEFFSQLLRVFDEPRGSGAVV